MKIIDKIKEEKIYGIIREDDEARAVEIANAYIEGGIRIIELNSSYGATKKIVEKYDDVIISQGGIITTSQAHQAIENGAKIIASPIFQTNLVRFATCYKTFLIPSATTPNEAYSAWRARMPLIKIYPVAEMGGVDYIKDMVKPMPFLNLMPSGYVKLEDITKYLEVGAKAVGVGRELYDKNSYQEIVSTVKEVKKMIK